MQDLFLLLVSKEEKTNLAVARSLNDAMKVKQNSHKIEKYGFNSEIVEIFKNYWDKSGSILKDYRDLDQHYLSIIKHTILQVDPTEKLIILLPDNPNERSRRKVSYNKQIDGIDFIKKSFDEFHQFVETVARIYNYKATKYNQPFPIQIKKIVPNKEATFALWFFPINKSIGHEVVQKEDGGLVFKPLFGF